ILSLPLITEVLEDPVTKNPLVPMERSKLELGDVVPIPTLPVEVIQMASVHSYPLPVPRTVWFELLPEQLMVVPPPPLPLPPLPPAVQDKTPKPFVVKTSPGFPSKVGREYVTLPSPLPACRFTY